MFVGKSARLMVALMAAESLTEMVVQLVLITITIIHVSVTVTVISVFTGAQGARESVSLQLRVGKRLEYWG